MKPWRPFCEALHVSVLGLWLGALGMGAASAGVLFPTMKRLAPRLPDFSAYSGDQWLIAAGHVGQKVFLILDVVQFACSLIAVVTFTALVMLRPRARIGASFILRAVALSIALASVAGEIFILAPSMNAALQAYWSAARAGNLDAALEHQQAFTAMHPMATKLMVLTAISVLISLALGAWAAATSRPAGEPGSRGLETPALLNART
ncbi:MAG: hypothetical protein KF745_02545 [Phycisphaeraceae bacterium]|nr:hypothetical protein [Phycisphaeraceae bacterium]